MSLIGHIGDFPDNSTRSVQCGHMGLLVVRRAGQLFLYENRCPHTRETLDPAGGSLASGDGLLIECQRHAAQFIADTGECVAGPCLGEKLQAIPYTLSDGTIYLD
jgi:nitrite reductase/ring-hydroxylating ferredoxin subunit